MLSPTSCDLSHEPKLNNKITFYFNLHPALTDSSCYALCRAWELLTTRMAVLWTCAGMCGTGIGVVFGGIISSFLFTKQYFPLLLNFLFQDCIESKES
jgi:hypothetical protein